MIYTRSKIRPLRKERGQALIEFVAVFPIALLALSLVLYAGYLMYAKLAAQNAAYSVAIAVPRSHSLTGGEIFVPEFNLILDDPTGMKSLWEFGWGDDYYSGFGGAGRLGGAGVTVGIDTYDNIFNNYLVFKQNLAEGAIPRATSFFLLSPFMSVRE